MSQRPSSRVRPGPSVQEVLAADRQAPPALLRETGEETQCLLAIAECGQRVLETDEALAHALNLFREQPVLTLERATARDTDATRDGSAAEHEQDEHDHGAETEQCFDERLRHFHGSGGSRTVRDNHYRPATLVVAGHQRSAICIGTANLRAVWMVVNEARCLATGDLRHTGAGFGKRTGGFST